MDHFLDFLLVTVFFLISAVLMDLITRMQLNTQGSVESGHGTSGPH